MTGPDVLLRPWLATDADDLVAIAGSSADLDRQLPERVDTLAVARRVIADALVCDDRSRSRSLAVVVDGHPVGNVTLSQIDRRHDTAWVSYFSSAAVRGQGLIVRSVIALADFALAPTPSGLGLWRLELGHRLDNPASGAVAVAAGFVPEGLERAKLRYGDHRYDVRTYARLADDPAPVVRPGRVRIAGT